MSNEHDDDDDIEHMDVFELPTADQLQQASFMGVPLDTLNTLGILMDEYIDASDAERPMLWRNLINYITTREFH